MSTAGRDLQKNGASHPGERELGDGPPAGPDLELMLFLDGELDEPGMESRRAEVEARLKADPAARAKADALRLASAFVAESSLASAPDVDVADAVMAALEADALQASSKGGVDAAEPARPLSTAPRGSAKSARRRSANDNGRTIFTLAAAAVAAAAAMMIWGRMEPVPVSSPVPAGTEEIAPPPGELGAPRTAEAPLALDPPLASDNDAEYGVEVAAVDFGAHMGTIFYVPTGPSASTTVVWVDDVGGE